MSWLTTLFTDIKHIFSTPKAKAVEQEIAALLPVAIGIVTEIDQIAPNKTLDQFNVIATKYALPTITALQDGQTAGNVALNLGTQILQKNHAPQAAISVLNTVIQLAVVAVNSAE